MIANKYHFLRCAPLDRLVFTCAVLSVVTVGAQAQAESTAGDTASTQPASVETSETTQTPAPQQPKPVVSARRLEARGLAKRGDLAFQVGRCDRAIPLWKSADEKFHAPTILLRIARCQALLGHVVDATATLRQIIYEKHPKEESAPFRAARTQAAEEFAGVSARIGRLRVVIDTRGLRLSPKVFVDLVPVTDSDKPHPLDPGKHQLRVEARGEVWEQVVNVDEGETNAVRIALSESVPVAAPRTQRTVGMVLGGVGLASMAVGAYFAASASTLARDLDGVCGTDRKQCPPSRKDDIERLQTHATVADVTLGGGLAFFAAGAVVVLTEKAPPSKPGKIQFFPVGLGAGVRGAF